jgi:hypothetical protein
MAEAFFNLTSTAVMARQLLDHAGSASELGSEGSIRQIVELFWGGIRRGLRDDG